MADSFWEIEVDGAFQNFNTDLDFPVTTSFGTGMPKVNNLLSPMALQPGGIFEGQNIQSRSFRLRGSIVGTSKTDGHAKRQKIIKAISSYKTSVSSQLPTRRLRFTGAAVEKDIYVVYDGGLEDEPPTGWGEIDRDLRFIAPDPLFYATSETTTALDSLDTDAAVYAWFGRVDGQWSNLSDPGAPGTAVYTSVIAIVSDDTYVYVGGNFTNFDNIANADYIVRYNKSTGAYSALSTGLNGIVNALAIDSNGDLIVAGAFTDAGGVGAADKIARWNGTAFSAIGTPAVTSGDVYAIQIAPNGDIYFGGTFLNLGSVANADGIGYWDLSASAYAALGTGISGGGARVNSIAFDSQSNVYIAGDFTTANGVSAADIAMWNGTTFEALGTGLSDVGRQIIIDAGGSVYVCGDFLTADGVTVNRIAMWNGTAFSALGAGAGNTIYSIQVDENNNIVAGGAFTTIGTLTNIKSRIAAWNGSSWVYPAINSDTGTVVSVVHLDGNDIYAGCVFTTFPITITYAGKTTIAYNGTAVAYSKITINRSGGTTAVVQSVVNYETSAVLYIDYSLLDGETLTVEGRPQEGIEVTSSLFGAVPNAILPGSNLSQFYLTPGNASGNNDNEIYAYVDTTGSPTITTNIIYKSAYISLD